MAAKGAIAKQEIAQKILNTFEGSFLYNDGKEIRINTVENGNIVQIKVALTCAKVPVEGGFVPPEAAKKAEIIDFTAATVKESVPAEPTEDEKERLATLLDKLGL